MEDEQLFDEFGNYIGVDQVSPNLSESDELPEPDHGSPDFIIDVIST